MYILILTPTIPTLTLILEKKRRKMEASANRVQKIEKCSYDTDPHLAYFRALF